MSNKETLPNERLRAAREHMRWTQEELAARLETDFETVSRWERGETVPRSDFRRRLCDVFDMTAEALGLAPDRNEPFDLPTVPYLVLASAHADAEHELVMKLKELLVDQDIPVLSSRMLRRQGRENKRRAIREARGVLVIVSPDARTSLNVQEALQIAKMYQRTVCAVWITGEHWEECVPGDMNTGLLFNRIDARKGLDSDLPAQIKTMLEPLVPGSHAVAMSLSAENRSQPGRSKPDDQGDQGDQGDQEHLREPRNPYKGLHAFHGEDARDFFGRDALVNELADALKSSLTFTQPGGQHARLLAVLGPSGSGKSSVVMAGLLPRLQAGALPGSEEWQYLNPMVPGAHPLESLTLVLADALSNLSNTSPSALHDDLASDSSRSLHLIAKLLAKQNSRRKRLPNLPNAALQSPDGANVPHAEGHSAARSLDAIHQPPQESDDFTTPGAGGQDEERSRRRDITPERAASLPNDAMLPQHNAYYGPAIWGTRMQVVLFIDQFEELFTQTRDEEEREQFINLLVTAMTEPRGPLVVLLTMRADFYDQLTCYPQLATLIQEHHHLALPMGIRDMRTVIEGPATRPDVQLTFEENLVGDLLFESFGQVGALPLLEFTLDQLFQRRSDHRLTVQAYQEIGGVRGALAQHAEATYLALPSEEHRRLARILFMRLIDPGATEQDTTRRRASLSELALPDAEQSAMIQQAVDAFVAARLLTVNRLTVGTDFSRSNNDARGGPRNEHPQPLARVVTTATVEVSHEALIREWPRLAGWLHEAREDIRFQHTLNKDTEEWELRNRPDARLYRGSQLQEATIWSRRNTPNQKELAFLRASKRRRTQSVASIFLAALLLLATTGAAGWLLTHQPPDTTKVTNLNDSGTGSLRRSIETAPAGSTITFAPGLHGTIHLINSLAIGKNLRIQGPGANILSISSSATDSAIQINPSKVAAFSDLAFKNSTITTSSIIYNQGILTLTRCLVADNEEGIFNESPGKLTIDHTIIRHNTIFGAGGGLYNTAGTVSIVDSAIDDNIAAQSNDVSGNNPSDGGGLFNAVGVVSIINSTITNNSSADDGGGIYDLGTLTISNSVISGNKAGGSGGGIIITTQDQPMIKSTVVLKDSKIQGNRAEGHSHTSIHVDGQGGGILDLGGSVDFTSCTISGNTAANKGGGIAKSVAGQVQLLNSPVNGNHAPANPDD